MSKGHKQFTKNGDVCKQMKKCTNLFIIKEMHIKRNNHVSYSSPVRLARTSLKVGEILKNISVQYW